MAFYNWNHGPYATYVFYGGAGEVRVAHCVDAQDLDCDGVLGIHDHCPGVANATQEDQDEDGIGDACDTPRQTECQSGD